MRMSPSANVIGELRGREKPDEFVVIGGHLDSWDVGAGASDDGGGIVGDVGGAPADEVARTAAAPHRSVSCCGPTKRMAAAVDARIATRTSRNCRVT